MPSLRPALLLAALYAAACHGDGGSTDLGVGGDLSGVVNTDGAAITDAASSCGRVATGDDATRTIVVSHPFGTTDGTKSSDFELLTLASSGKISQPNIHFSLGIANEGQVVFTPDAQLGYVAADDGSIGIFKLNATGAPTIVNAAFQPGFTASNLWLSQSGDQLYGLDAETTSNHGGIYMMTIACDGTLSSATQLTAADLPYAALPLPGGRIGIYAHSLPGGSAGENVHLATLGPPFMRQASAVGFADDPDDAIIAGAAATADGRYLLFGDNSEFASVPNRITAIEVTATGLRFAQLLTPVMDPVSIVASPYGNVMLVASGYQNALLTLAYDATNTTTPFLNKGEITYMGAKPELPGVGVAINRGALRGRVYVSETQGIRQLRFETAGTVTDLGKFSVGAGNTSIVGAIGVTP